VSIRHSYCIPLVFFLFLVGVHPGTSNAEDDVFSSEITVTATGTEEPTEEIPLPITVITEEEINDAQTESVTDILRRVPGLNVVQSAGPGSVTSVFTRGTESDHTLVMIDGVRLNSPYFGGFDFSQLSTAGLGRIEVARGPYSALWGADAIGGAINVIPGSGADGFHGGLLAEGGEGAWERYQATVAFGSDNFDIMATGLNRTGKGDLQNSDFDLQQGLVNAGFTWGKGSRVSLLYLDVDSDLGIPFSSPGSMTPSRRQKTTAQTLAIPLRWTISSRWSLEATVSTVDRDLDFADPDDPWGFTWSHTETETTQVRLASHNILGNHRLSWGAEWREDEVTDGSVYGPNLDAADSDMTSLFAQDVWRLSTGLTLVFGARWDDTDQWGSEISPRANLGWKVSDSIELRAGYGEAYRQPSIGELFYPFSGNPDLQPETSRSAEIGLIWGGRETGAPRLEFNLFSTDIENMIVFDYASYSLRNIGQAEIDGFEAALNFAHNEALSSQMQITWLDTSDGFGNELLRRPEWSGAYTLTGVFLPWLKGWATIRYVGDRFDVDPLTFETTRTDSFITADLALAAQVWDSIELTLRTINLLDEEYEEVLGYPAQGRRIIGGVRVDF
jgi:vitamin B12 transporter